MNLTIDIGNTRTKTALFSNNELLETAIWLNWSLVELKKLLADKKEVTKVILSATGKIPADGMVEYLEQNYTFILLSDITPLPIKNEYRTPHTLGKDRIASAVGASVLHPNTSCLVIDAGTCVTYDFLQDGTAYIGGLITPGYKMRLQAMNHFTARLPLVEKEENSEVDIVGNDTKTSLLAGAEMGLVAEIMGIIFIYQKNGMHPFEVILTGGNAEMIGKHLHNLQLDFIRIEKNIVPIGLNKILENS
jgi:type III pantothenate kinase